MLTMRLHKDINWDNFYDIKNGKKVEHYKNGNKIMFNFFK